MAGFDSAAPSIPAVEMAGFGLLSPSTPGVEMAGFDSLLNSKYRPTVSRLIPSSQAIRRWDQPRSAKLYIVVCWLTFRTFDMPTWSRTYEAQRDCFYFPKVAGFEALNFDL
jgi:hypothetical protein